MGQAAASPVTSWIVDLPRAEAARLASRAGPLYNGDGHRIGVVLLGGFTRLDDDAFEHLRGLTWPHDDFRIERDGAGYVMVIGEDPPYPVVREEPPPVAGPRPPGA